MNYDADSPPSLRYLIAGKLTRDYLLLPNGTPALDQPGGSLFYAASGLGLWERGIGLLTRVGEDYSQAWLEQARQRGFDLRGVRILPESIDLRQFTGYTAGGTAQNDDPVAHFARLGLPFPKELLDYHVPSIQVDSRTLMSPLAVRPNDIPTDYLDAAAAHICPQDYLSHSLLPSMLRQGHITTITLDPAAGYMNPNFWDAVPSIVTGLNAFLTNEDKARTLFQGRTSDLWEMAECMASWGCDLIVIKRGERGQMLYDRGAKTRWAIPAYPAQIVDPTGAGDAFCGGFLAGLRQTYDPLQAVLRGNISASFTLEGMGPFYTMDAYPRLAEARLETLQGMVRRV